MGVALLLSMIHALSLVGLLFAAIHAGGCSLLPSQYETAAGYSPSRIAPDLRGETRQYAEVAWKHIAARWGAEECQPGEWVTYLVVVDMQGRVKRVDTHAWHASKSCLRAASAAVVRSSPLPPPPKSLEDVIWRSGLVFTFKRK